ncbi:uncharacterized protein LOC116249452 isoform X1 [Nymphaea colorata]|nr:uncharacterized protein LOC116249452 isoform X1 [Nymphaea colorata]
MMIKREDGKKGERKGRFFACFRPHADATDPPARKDTGSESVLALIAVSKKELIPVIVEPKAKQNMETLSLNSESSRRKKPCRFLGLKRAIFCNAKGRICDGKVQQDPRRSSESAKIFLVEPIPPVKPQEQERKLGGSPILKSDSNCLSPSSSFSPFSTSSSVLSRSKKSNSISRRKTDFATVASGSRHGKQASSPRSESGKAPIPDGEKGPEPALGPIIGLFCFLAFSLSVTVIWGRIYAILFTLIWSCFVGRRRELSSPENIKRPESPIVPPEPDSIEYRKRVIMEGILERSHRHRAPKRGG